jgi:hypothetical protein
MKFGMTTLKNMHWHTGNIRWKKDIFLVAPARRNRVSATSGAVFSRLITLFLLWFTVDHLCWVLLVLFTTVSLHLYCWKLKLV